MTRLRKFAAIQTKAAALVATAAAVLLCGPAVADVVHLKNGQRLEGSVIEADGQVKIVSTVGTIGFPADIVARIERGDSFEEQALERLRALPPNDIQGRIDLAIELERAGATTLAQRIYQSVLDRDPDDPTARRALGYVACDEEWLTVEECHRRRGEVLHQGRWVTADQRTMLEAIEQERRRSELERLRSDIEVESARLRAEREAAATSYGRGGYYDPYYDPYYYGGGYPYYPIYPGWLPPLRPGHGDGRLDGNRPSHHTRPPNTPRAQGGLHHRGGQPARPLTPTHTTNRMTPGRR
jgi:hypothetical protein